MSLKLTVDKKGSGDHTDITSALNAVIDGEAAVIYIKNGVYREKLIIDKPNITFIGEDREKTVLTYGDSAKMPDETGEPMGTFKTASVHVMPSAAGFNACNLTFENSAGVGSAVGQAVALYLDCDKAVIKDCNLTAHQDTLLAAPIFSDIERDPCILNRQLFKNCFIKGDVDFIFGGAAAVFEDCTIFCRKRPAELPCYVTAACTSDKLEYGFVFRNCHITGDAEDNTVYLGRPWRQYANTVFINCNMDKCVSKKSFCRWNDTDRHLTSFYAQYGSYGEGAENSTPEDWTRVLTAEEALKYETDKVFDGWKPEIPAHKG